MASEADKKKLEEALLNELKELKGKSDSPGRKKIGLIEDVWVKGTRREKKVQAKIDTGASKSSISKDLLIEIGEPRSVGKALVASAMSEQTRPLVELLVSMETGRWVKSIFTVAERHNMQYPLLIGKNTLLKLNVIVDPTKEVQENL